MPPFPPSGVELLGAEVKGEEGERRDWEEEGVGGVGVEVVGWRGRGEVPALAELEMDSLRQASEGCSREVREVRLEIELRRLEEEVEPSLLAAVTEGFSPLFHMSGVRGEGGRERKGEGVRARKRDGDGGKEEGGKEEWGEREGRRSEGGRRERERERGRGSKQAEQLHKQGFSTHYTDSLYSFPRQPDTLQQSDFSCSGCRNTV